MKNESRLLEAQRLAIIGNWEYDHKEKLFYWTAGLYKIFEYDLSTTGELSYEQLIAKIHPNDQERVLTAYKDALQKGSSYDVEYNIILNGQKERSIYEKSESFFDRNGNLLRTLGTVQDISEVKKIEIQLLRSEWNLNSIVECSPNTILILRGEQILYANNTAGQLLSIPSKELISCNIHKVIEILGSEKINNIINRISNISSTEEDGTFEEYRIQIMSGEKKWVGLWGVEIFYSGDIASLIYIEDITTKKEAQIQLMQGDKMATIGLLAAGVAHEINNPTAYIQSNLNSLKKYFETIENFYKKSIDFLKELRDHDKAKDLINYIETQDLDFIFQDIKELINECLEGTLKVSEIVRDIKSFAHADNEQLEVSDVNKIIKSTLNMLWNRIKYNSEVKLELTDNLPKTLCNSRQVSQVLMNLILNSEQAIETSINKIQDRNNKIRGLITIRTKYVIDEKNSREEWIIISICDNGPGIPKENLARIFDPFFTTKDVGEGTGLGLSIVYEIIQKHNGKITVESEIGKGTEFNVILPVK